MPKKNRLFDTIFGPVYIGSMDKLHPIIRARLFKSDLDLDKKIEERSKQESNNDPELLGLFEEPTASIVIEPPLTNEQIIDKTVSNAPAEIKDLIEQTLKKAAQPKDPLLAVLDEIEASIDPEQLRIDGYVARRMKNIKTATKLRTLAPRFRKYQPSFVAKTFYETSLI